MHSLFRHLVERRCFQPLGRVRMKPHKIETMVVRKNEDDIFNFALARRTTSNGIRRKQNDQTDCCISNRQLHHSSFSCSVQASIEVVETEKPLLRPVHFPSFRGKCLLSTQSDRIGICSIENLLCSSSNTSPKKNEVNSPNELVILGRCVDFENRPCSKLSICDRLTGSSPLSLDITGITGAWMHVSYGEG